MPKAYAIATAPRILTWSVYDCFTGTVIMMLEGLGYAQGEGRPFVDAGQITYGGVIPYLTHGGLLVVRALGHAGLLFRTLRLSTGCVDVAATARW